MCVCSCLAPASAAQALPLLHARGVVREEISACGVFISIKGISALSETSALFLVVERQKKIIIRIIRKQQIISSLLEFIEQVRLVAEQLLHTLVHLVDRALGLVV